MGRWDVGTLGAAQMSMACDRDIESGGWLWHGRAGCGYDAGEDGLGDGAGRMGFGEGVPQDAADHALWCWVGWTMAPAVPLAGSRTF